MIVDIFPARSELLVTGGESKGVHLERPLWVVPLPEGPPPSRAQRNYSPISSPSLPAITTGAGPIPMISLMICSGPGSPP